MAINNQASKLKAQITDEIRQYTTEVVNVGEAYDYSQYKLTRRITLFESHTYPTGKFDSQGNYKLWYDGISSRISNEVKNIDFDTKDVKVHSDRAKDDLAVIITNLKLKEYLRDTGQDEEFNAAVEQGSGWGNAVWKKVNKSYQRMDLKNFYVINQTAEDLDDSPVIERHQLTSADLRAKAKVWENVKEVLKGVKSDSFKSTIEGQAQTTTVPYYDIYERNGDVCLADLKEVHGEVANEGDEDIYVFAKVIVAGKKSTAAGVAIELVLFAEEMKGKSNCDIYKEFHRGVYKGKWFREGLYELLFDQQVRLNQIGNQLALGLEFASKIIFQSKDKLIVQNILTDMKNGDIIRTDGLAQVPVAMEGFTQLVSEWNIVQQHMNDIANSSPIVTGEGMPQRMPFQVAALLNQNANKLFDYIRQKLAIPFTAMFDEWIVPELVAQLTAEEILRLTGDSTMLSRLYGMIVDAWYVKNMVAIGPHGQDIADTLKAAELSKLIARPQLLMQGLQESFKDFEPSTSCVITGENSSLPEEMQTLSTFIALEQDPIRRSALIEMALAKKGFDVAALPKTPPALPAPAGGDPNAQEDPTVPKPSPLQPNAQGKVMPINGNPALTARPRMPQRGKVA